jgi:hypothetical protein
MDIRALSAATCAAVCLSVWFSANAASAASVYEKVGPVDPAGELTCDTGPDAGKGSAGNDSRYTLRDATVAWCYSGTNASEVVLNDTDGGFAGYNDWVLSDKFDYIEASDSFTDSFVPNGPLELTFENETGTSEGEWGFNVPGDTIYSRVAVVLKASNDFAAFLVAGDSGFWSIETLKNGNIRDLSNISVFYDPNSGGTPGGPAGVVPLPAGIVLLLGGLGALGVARRAKATRA